MREILSHLDNNPANENGLPGERRCLRGALGSFTVSLLIAGVLIGSVAAMIGTPLAPVAFVNPGFVYPIVAPRKSSGYGWRVHPIRRFGHSHSGIDLAAPEGVPIRTVAAGKVVFADPYAGYGNFVTIEHQGGFTTHYGHCSTIKARPGQMVRAGEIIATVGSTGTSTGPHLHFEVRVNGTPQNPEKYIPGLGKQAEG